MVMKIINFLMVLLLAFSAAGCADAGGQNNAAVETTKTAGDTMKLKINGKTFNAVMYDNPAAKKLLDQLPHSYTPLGKIENISGLENAIGKGNIEIGFMKE